MFSQPRTRNSILGRYIYKTKWRQGCPLLHKIRQSGGKVEGQGCPLLHETRQSGGKVEGQGCPLLHECSKKDAIIPKDVCSIVMSFQNQLA